MAANIEQIFRDFVMNKIKEIEDEGQDASQSGECHSNGSKNCSVDNAGQQDLPHPMSGEAVKGQSGSAEHTDPASVKPDLARADRGDAPRKKSKKHKRHKSKKKKKKRKGSSSESGAESNGETHSSKKKKKKKKKRKEGNNKSSTSVSVTESEAESKIPAASASSHEKLPWECDQGVILAKPQDLPDIIPKVESSAHKSTDVSDISAGLEETRRRGVSRSRSDSRSRSRRKSRSASRRRNGQRPDRHRSRSRKSQEHKSRSFSPRREKRSKSTSRESRPSRPSSRSRRRSRSRSRPDGKGRYSRSRSRSRRRSRSFRKTGSRRSRSRSPRNRKSRSSQHSSRSQSRSLSRCSMSHSAQRMSRARTISPFSKSVDNEQDMRTESVSRNTSSPSEEGKKLKDDCLSAAPVKTGVTTGLVEESTPDAACQTVTVPKGSWRPVPFLVTTSTTLKEEVRLSPTDDGNTIKVPLTASEGASSVPEEPIHQLACAKREDISTAFSMERHSPGSPARNKPHSPTTTNRSRSKSPDRSRHSKPDSMRRKRSKSASKKRRSETPVKRSSSRGKRRKSRTPSRRRRSRSKSRTRKKRSRSKSPERTRSKSRSRSRRKRSRSAEKRRRTESRSPGRGRRSRSGSGSRRRHGGFGRMFSGRDRWKREPSRSPVLILRKKRSGSQTQRGTSQTPPRLTELDKDQLLEIAKANAAAMCAKAGMPIPESLRPKSVLQLPLPSTNPTPLTLPLPLPVNMNVSSMTMNAAMASMTAATMTALSTIGALASMQSYPPLPTITNKPPPAATMPNLANIEEAKQKVIKQVNSISIKELTEKCKQIAESKEEMAIAKPHVSDDEDDERPFAAGALKENRGISFSLNNTSVKPAGRTDAAFAKEFPVSSGSQHRKKECDGAYGEWVPVEKNGEKSSSSAGADAPGKSSDSVFPEAPSQAVDITVAVSERAVAQKRLAENPFDINAMCMLVRAQEQVDAWAQSNTIPGLFTGSTGAQVLSSDELSNSGPQAWIKKAQSL
ncbi:protein SON isoform X2 [Denticeps clupeoides]|uniref:protein SON isoform X2 n=1 Tax=Denticeps clupeoides TaxID=299321 RepID=UPI0010A52838|nr:protein SON isoform X2 [Denticeps clupeoides]